MYVDAILKLKVDLSGVPDQENVRLKQFSLFSFKDAELCNFVCKNAVKCEKHTLMQKNMNLGEFCKFRE